MNIRALWQDANENERPLVILKFNNFNGGKESIFPEYALRAMSVNELKTNIAIWAKSQTETSDDVEPIFLLAHFDRTSACQLARQLFELRVAKFDDLAKKTDEYEKYEVEVSSMDGAERSLKAMMVCQSPEAIDYLFGQFERFKKIDRAFRIGMFLLYLYEDLEEIETEASWAFNEGKTDPIYNQIKETFARHFPYEDIKKAHDSLLDMKSKFRFQKSDRL